MRIVTNKKLAKRNRQIATYLFIGTMVVLIGGFLLINQPLLTGPEDLPSNNTMMLIAQSLVLPIAFVMTLFSIRMTNKWARSPRPEDAIAAGLKGLSNKSVLYNYYHFPARHVLICPQGVFAIITRWHDWNITVDGDQWRTNKSAMGRFLSGVRMDGIGRPSVDAQQAADHLKKALAPIAPDVNVQPIIIFTDPRAELEISDPAVPVLFADPKQQPNFKDFLRDINRAAAEAGEKSTLPLTEDQIEAFEQATIK